MMPDRQKVIAWLNEIVNTLGSFTDDSEQEVCQLAKDALALLKELEDKPVLDEFGKCFLNALKRQLDMKLTMIELLITPDFAEKIVELIEKMFD